MTVFCGGGASRPKPGVNELVIFSSSQLGSFLNNKGGLWASLAIGALGVLTYQATQLCETDPPAQPTLTATDYSALLKLEPAGELTTALGKLRDLITRAVWFDLCECSSGTTPAPPTNLLPPPAGVTLPDYGLTPCAQPRLLVDVRGGVNSNDQLSNITRQAFPNLPIVLSSTTDQNYLSQDIAEIPPSWTNVYSTTQLVSGSTPSGFGYAVDVSTFGANGARRSSLLLSTVTSAVPFDRSPDSGASAFNALDRYFSVNAWANNSQITNGRVEWTMNVTCSGQSATQPGCCLDPTLYALVTQLMQQVNLIREDTTLLQRYGLPFAYTTGATHAGLVGSGSLPLARAVGLRIGVDAHPASNPTHIGMPAYIMDLGWISVLTPDGMLDEIRLTRLSTTWMSKLIPSATTLGWGLREGVTITITELLAEP
jgi:hypothetical protein